MPKKKQNKDSESYNYEDYEDLRRGNRKEKRRARRQNEKKWLDDVANGYIDSEVYKDQFEENQ
jgi:hypothetical protein